VCDIVNQRGFEGFKQSHPVWGVELLYCCWLLVGQRWLVGVGGGRKRLNILGAYCPMIRSTWICV
jgi:hypothetical protein